MPKQHEPSYRPKPITQKQAVAPLSKLLPKNATRSLEDRRPVRKPMRHDEDDDDEAEAIKAFTSLFNTPIMKNVLSLRDLESNTLEPLPDFLAFRKRSTLKLGACNRRGNRVCTL
ncbi:hypothetical protein RND71_023162 [Anisodus tanguticus]|uniref:Uncharacterized protein n=1 Tax=Anisodus tanguticus TaxID=243964 RepID=A0AAE1RUA3_9SOLA|nr:hypothetical protein RND71_023162 [Anisodus tanguticus]